MSFYKLQDEAEKEEHEDVRWKYAKLIVRCLAFRNHLIQKDIL